MIKQKHFFLFLTLGTWLALTGDARSETTSTVENVEYKTVSEKRSLLLDLYYPKGESDKALPLVVYTHGGGWAAGSKDAAKRGSMQKVVEGLTANGFCFASVEYRLYKKGGNITIKDCVTDCKDAIRFLAKNHEEYRIDPNQIFTFGDSAGGQIAQMLLLTLPELLPGDESLQEQSYKTIAGVSWYGPCDFEKTELFNHDGREGFRDRFGPRILKPDHNPEKKLELYREMSPINYLSGESPALLMIQGDGDTTIPVHHAHHMKARAEEISAPVEILIIKNAGHNWRMADGKTPIEPTREYLIQKTVDFLTAYLPN